VLALRAERVRVSGQPFTLNADGEISGPETDHAWHVERGVLNMVLPGG
jgi:hypothetical protein